MSKNPAPDSAGGLESPEPPERALARAIVADAVDRYIEATRARIAPFVDDHFSFTGAWALHRRALGRDLLRAPVNVMLVLPQVVLLPAGAALARWVGWRRAADWLGSRQLLRETGGQARRVQADGGGAVHGHRQRRPRDRVARSHRVAAAPVSAGPARIDPRCPRRGGARRPANRGRGPRTAGGTRSANGRCGVPPGPGGQARRVQAESVRGGGAVHGHRQRGDRRRGVQAIDVRGDESGSGARPRSAPSATPSRAFPSGPGSAASGTACFRPRRVRSRRSGPWPAWPSRSACSRRSRDTLPCPVQRRIVADPVQRRIGRHRRLLERLVAALGRSLRGGGPGRFAVRDHWIARLLDVVDLLRTAWSKLH